MGVAAVIQNIELFEAYLLPGDVLSASFWWVLNENFVVCVFEAFEALKPC